MFLLVTVISISILYPAAQRNTKNYKQDFGLQLIYIYHKEICTSLTKHFLQRNI